LHLSALLYSSMTAPPPPPPLFPYTPLFRPPTSWTTSPPRGWGGSSRAPTTSARRGAPITASGSPPTLTRARISPGWRRGRSSLRSEEHTSELQSLTNLVCRPLLGKKKHTDE